MLEDAEECIRARGADLSHEIQSVALWRCRGFDRDVVSRAFIVNGKVGAR